MTPDPATWPRDLATARDPPPPETERDPYLSLADVLKGRAAELQARNDRAADERAAAAITSGDKITSGDRRRRSSRDAI